MRKREGRDVMRRGGDKGEASEDACWVHWVVAGCGMDDRYNGVRCRADGVAVGAEM